MQPPKNYVSNLTLKNLPACYLPAIALAQARRAGRHIAMAGRCKSHFIDFLRNYEYLWLLNDLPAKAGRLFEA